MVEAGRFDVVKILLADESPVRDERDPSDAEPGLVVGHHLGQRR